MVSLDIVLIDKGGLQLILNRKPDSILSSVAMDNRQQQHVDTNVEDLRRKIRQISHNANRK